MICPNKKCRMEIDDDSRFCDQCGSEIMVCPKCGLPGTGKFCRKDGVRLEPVHGRVETPPGADDTAPLSAGEQGVNQAQQGDSGTASFDLNSEGVADTILIAHSTGFELRVQGSAIFGRNEGPFASELAGFRYISRRHADIFSNEGKWFIRDHGSTNKSRLNGTVLEPEKVYPLKKGDRVMLADQEFTVK